ncbi:MAG TPA: pilus assembly protein PilY, partial [Gammaproteobacteria bacterium]|nr:pilus assembly protein PilY [Gammaproteobacteria bacterium]
MKAVNRNKHILRRSLSSAGALAIGLMAGGSAYAAAPPITISDVPMTLVLPAHPQVMLIVGNSGSMDGNLSGAIMTGSGTIESLKDSSSPEYYTVPEGFTPPFPNTETSGSAPYTWTVDSTAYDNSPSRLNVAKAAIEATLDKFARVTDFGLMDFKLAETLSRYDTWVYYMSNAGGFTFTSDENDASVPDGSQIIDNPCYNSTADACDGWGGVDSYYTADVTSLPYMVIANSSDEPEINDVLYATGLRSVFVTYDGPYADCSGSPCLVDDPYPPTFTLADYNAGNILLKYKSSTGVGDFVTGPTNAGFVAYSDEVMYAKRGFAYSADITSNTGNVVVPISSAGQNPSQQDVDNYIAKFTPYLKPETNNAETDEIKAAGVQSPIAGVLKKAHEIYTGTDAPASSNGCDPLRFVILLTDGLPTADLDGNAWPPLGSAAAKGYVVTASFNDDGSLNTTNDEALTDTIEQLEALREAGVRTYVIGLGAGVDPDVNPDAAKTLTAMAMAGGTSD